MANKIHSSAFIDASVIMGDGNTIGPNVVMRGAIRLGDGNEIGAQVVIENNVIIGSGNRLAGSSWIGSLGEMGSKGDVLLEDGVVLIGDRNVIREFVTINSPVRKRSTVIGNDGYFMARTHIPHDAAVGNHVVMATNSLVGGGSVVSDHAYLGLGSITHQWVDIGESGMVGLQAAVTKHVPPFCLVAGVPARIMKLNRVGAERRGYEAVVLDEAADNLRDIVAGIYHSDNELVKKIQDFIQAHPDSCTFMSR